MQNFEFLDLIYSPIDDILETIYINIPLYIVAVCLIALVVLMTLLIIKRLRATNKSNTENHSNGIYMKLEVISGECETESREFYLKNILFIGRDSSCDIIFSNPEVSGKNSRIFISNNMPYIEDINSANGSYIGGMKIFAQNRLRSGDMISIGNVQFSLRF